MTLAISDINLQIGTIYIPSRDRHNSRTIALHSKQILPIHSYIKDHRPNENEEQTLFPYTYHRLHAYYKQLSRQVKQQSKTALNLDQVITNKWTKHGFGCPTCTNGGKPWINELIDQLDHFKQFKDVDGCQTVLNQLLDQGKTQAIGSHWVMKFTNVKKLSPTAFEDFINEFSGDFSADIIEKLPDGTKKLIECKSWGSKPSGMSNVPNQMINYFNTQNSLSNFEFQFDPDRWIPSPSDLNQALKANTNLFDINKWSNYQQMFDFTTDVPYGDFNKLIDHVTNVHFNNIINP